MKTRVMKMKVLSPPPKQWIVNVLAGGNLRNSVVLRSDLLTEEEADKLLKILHRDLR